MHQLRVGPLPDTALEAAAHFHAEVLPGLLDPARKDEDLVIVFAPAPYDHQAWRLAVVQELARAAVPHRVNGISGEDEAAIAEILAFFASSPGITGQLLAVDGKFTETR